MFTARETVTSRKNGRGHRLTITGGNWARERPVSDKAPQKEAHAGWSKNGKEMHLPKIPGGIIGNPRTTAISPCVFLVGKHEKESDDGRKALPRDHWIYLRQLAEKYGEAARLGKVRETRGAQHPQRGSKGDSSCRGNFCSASKSRTVELISL